MYCIGRARFSRIRVANLGSNLFHTTRCTAASGPNHTPDTYSKEVDMTPAADKAVNRLDPDTDTVQRPIEPPSGPWSRAGTKTDEYRHVESGGGRKPPDGRYGGKAEEKGSGPEEGPGAKSRDGRG